MKKKVLVLTLLALFVLSGIVSAANLWGTYKGNSIIRVTSNGNVIKPNGVPAISYQGATMVPTSILKQSGVNVTWDQKNQSLDIQGSKTTYSQNDPVAVAKQIISLGGGGFTLTNVSGKLTAMTYFTPKSSFDSDWNAIYTIFVSLSNYNTEFSYVGYGDQGGITIATKVVRDYLTGSVTQDQLQKSWILSGNISQSKPTNKQPSTKITNNYPELYSSDGKVYLGKLTSDKYDTDSIFNEYGNYGSKYSSESIWNEYGDYGSKYSSKSAFNKYASDPPIIILNNKIIGYITVNTTTINGISPYSLLKWLSDNGY
jgi:hypothetical protein